MKHSIIGLVKHLIRGLDETSHQGLDETSHWLIPNETESHVFDMKSYN
jgi:hypothetical protein